MGNITSLQMKYNKLSSIPVVEDGDYPPYYIPNVCLTDADMAKATSSWNLIMGSTNTTPFMEAQRNSNFNYASCLLWFFDVFYERFFELSPEALPLFSFVSITSQGRLVAGVISSALGLLQSPQLLRDRLTLMTSKHKRRGVRPDQYGKMGAALIWAMRIVLGESFLEEHRVAWTRLYSYLLSIIVPVAKEESGASAKSVFVSPNNAAFCSNQHRGSNVALSHRAKVSACTDKDTGSGTRCLHDLLEGSSSGKLVAESLRMSIEGALRCDHLQRQRSSTKSVRARAVAAAGSACSVVATAELASEDMT